LSSSVSHKSASSAGGKSLSLPLSSVALPTGTDLPLTSIIGGVTTVISGVALPTGTELPLTSIIGGVTTVISGVALPTGTELPLTSVIGGVTSILDGGGILPTGSAGLPLSSDLPVTSILSDLPLTSLALPTITSLPVSVPLSVSQSLGFTESLSLSVGPVSLSLGAGGTVSLGASGLPLSVTVANPVPSVSVPLLGGLRLRPHHRLRHAHGPGPRRRVPAPSRACARRFNPVWQTPSPAADPIERKHAHESRPLCCPLPIQLQHDVVSALYGAPDADVQLSEVHGQPRDLADK